MRSLRVVGLGDDGKVVIVEDAARGERFQIPADERLRAAARGDITRLGQIAIELESQMRPREIQSRIRAGESVEQVAAAAGVPANRVERFAYPVLLERSRTAELAQRAHPIREDGPDLQELGEVVSQAFAARGQDYTAATWDSWKGEDGKWVIQLTWTAGRSHNRAHWSFHPGAHGGTVTPLDDHSVDLLDPNPNRQLRTVRPVTELAAQALQAERPLEPVEEPIERRQAVNGGEPPRRTDEPEPRTEQEFVQDFELTDEPGLPVGLTQPEPPVKPSPTPRNRPAAGTPAPTRQSAPPRQPADAPSPTPRQPAETDESPAVDRPAAPPRQPATDEPAPTRTRPTATPDEPTPNQPAANAPTPTRTRPTATPDEPTPNQPAANAPTPTRTRPTATPRQPATDETTTTPSQPAAEAPTRAPAAPQRPADEPDPQEPPAPAAQAEPEPTPEPEAAPAPAAKEEPKPAPATRAKKGKKARPTVPSWEDVLLGTRSNR